MIVINMKKFLKIEDAKDREAVLQHEFGHRKLHTVNMRGGVVDRKRIDDELRREIAKELKAIAKLNGHDDDSKLAHKINFYVGMHLSDEDIKEQKASLIAKRKLFRDKLRPLTKPNTHASLLEFEADQYAANKMDKNKDGKDKMIHALKEMDKLDKTFDKVDIDNLLEEVRNTETYRGADKNKKKKLEQNAESTITYNADIRHLIHKHETRAREKALDSKVVDTDIRSSLTD